MKKMIKELKWLFISALLVVSTIGLVIGVANLSQWQMERNVERSIANGVTVNYTYWNEVSE